MTQTTNKLVVVSVSERGAMIAVNGENKPITWREFMDAAEGGEWSRAEELPKLYHTLLADAREMVCQDRRIPIRMGVSSRTSGASFYSYVSDCSGQTRSEFRPADADGQQTKGECRTTVREMMTRAKRMGYDAIDEGCNW